MTKLWVVLSLAILSAFPSTAETIFDGLPVSKIVSSSDGTEAIILTTQQRMKNRVVIEKRDDRYFWTTRGGVELEHRVSGIYEIYTATTGAGYVKIEMPLTKGQPFNFLEHVHISLGTITYFGSTYDFKN
jgi:hypothetical protein